MALKLHRFIYFIIIFLARLLSRVLRYLKDGAPILHTTLVNGTFARTCINCPLQIQNARTLKYLDFKWNNQILAYLPIIDE